MTLPLDEPWSAALTIPHDQVRVTFAYPWEGMLLLGTTDTLYEGDPAEVAATEDGHRPRARARQASPSTRRLLRKERVLSTYAGLRVLPRSDGTTVDARRETAFLRRQRRDAHGRRRQADDVPPHRARRARALVGRARASQRIDRRPVPLPGATDAGNVAARLVTRLGRSSPRSPPISPTSTARGPTASSASPPSGRSCSSGCTRTRRTSPLRSSSPPGRNGRRAPTTSCTAARPSAPAASRARGRRARRRLCRSQATPASQPRPRRAAL